MDPGTSLRPRRPWIVQISIGADIMMCFDECTAYPVTRETAEKSMGMTHAWAKQCKAQWEAREASQQALFGIVQGSVFEDLRREEARRGSLTWIFPAMRLGGERGGE